jgi:site-specific DNA recombinase
VQEKLAGNAVDRQVRLKGSAALLAGRLYDDRGNRMSPAHANKKGVRYRYYVSQAPLQNRKSEAGSIARVPAPEIESLVYDGVRQQLAAMGRTELANSLTDREPIEHLVARGIATPKALDVCLNPASEASAQVDDPTLDNPAAGNPQITITLPWAAPSFAAVKGIIHEPSEIPTIKPESREALLNCRAGGRGRTALPPARSPRFPIAPHHCRNR